MTPQQPPQPYAVYHATNMMAMIFPNPQDWMRNREQHYQHVANVHTQLHRVFALTNHTNGENWTEREEVFWVAPEESPRSTSVGDVIYSPTTSRAWLVDRSGLQEIKVEAGLAGIIPIEQDDFVSWLCEHETEVVGHAGTRFGSPLVEWLSLLFGHQCTIEDTTCGWMSLDWRWIWRTLPDWGIRFQQKVGSYAYRPMTGSEALSVLASVELSLHAMR